MSLALSLVWIVAVALVPASARPNIGSTLSNNPWEMVFGYNGLGRFGEVTADDTAYRSFTPPFSGSPSALRLLNEALATQIGWMLPTAVVAVVVLLMLRFRMPRPSSRPRGSSPSPPCSRVSRGCTSSTRPPSRFPRPC